MSTDKWSPEFIKRFLHEYRKYPCLWDVNNPQHKNREERVRVERAIFKALDMKVDVRVFRSKVRNIRNTYRLEIYKINRGRRWGNPYRTKLTWFPIAHQFLCKTLGIPDRKYNKDIYNPGPLDVEMELLTSKASNEFSPEAETSIKDEPTTPQHNPVFNTVPSPMCVPGSPVPTAQDSPMHALSISNPESIAVKSSPVYTPMSSPEYTADQKSLTYSSKTSLVYAPTKSSEVCAAVQKSPVYAPTKSSQMYAAVQKSPMYSNPYSSPVCTALQKSPTYYPGTSPVHAVQTTPSYGPSRSPEYAGNTTQYHSSLPSPVYVLPASPIYTHEISPNLKKRLTNKALAKRKKVLTVVRKQKTKSFREKQAGEEREPNNVQTVNTVQKPGTENEYEIFGKYVATQLKQLPAKKAITLQIEINNLIGKERLNVIELETVTSSSKNVEETGAVASFTLAGLHLLDNWTQTSESAQNSDFEQ
ncbi:hypothetical protein SK128_024816 [Halocaridina rubra]|uniref:MADF domain-containing protein n=1 Tax=Halocaridina rubra TaxID=373956 RepID=A0AAN8X3B4_HALRR